MKAPICRTTPLREYPQYLDEFFQEPLPFPEKIFFGLTSRCELRCIMCHHSLPGRSPVTELSDLVWGRMKEAIGAATEIVVSGSGDPCMHPRFAEMMNEVGALRRPQVILHTSMNFWGKNHADAVVRNVHELYMSIDAVCSETYEKIRVRGDFEKVVANIRKVVARRKELGISPKDMSISWGILPMALNLEEVARAPQLAAELGVDEILLQPLFEIDRIDQSALHPSLLPRLREVLEETRENCERYGIRYHNTIQHVECSAQPVAEPQWAAGELPGVNEGASQEMFAWQQPTECPNVLECADAFRQIMIYADGTVHACGDRFNPMGNLNEATFAEIWNGERFTTFRQGVMTSGRKVCPGCVNQRWIPEPNLENLPMEVTASGMTNLERHLGFWWLETGNKHPFRWTKPRMVLFLRNPGGPFQFELNFEYPPVLQQLHHGEPLTLVIAEGAPVRRAATPGYNRWRVAVAECAQPFVKVELSTPVAYRPAGGEFRPRDHRELGIVFYSAAIKPVSA